MMKTEERVSELLQLVYVSAATTAFDDESLERLLEKARATNSGLGVTGVLLFKDDTFFQVLEGDPETVLALYDKIATDTRHANVLKLAAESVNERNFGEWSMGYVRAQAVQELDGFVDYFTDRTFLDLAGDSKRLDHILTSFRRGRWRRNAAPSQPALA
jgi:hypothetical protein